MLGTRLGHRPPRRVRQPELEERILEVAGPPGEAVANTQVANDDVEREAGTAAHGSPIQGQPQLPVDAARRYVDAYHVGEPRPEGMLGRVLAPRARILFLSILFLALTIVLAIFGLVIAAVLGGITNPLYSLLVAYTNDYLDRSDMASASAGLIFINGLGAVSGPLITGWMMGRIGPNGYFLFMGLLLAGLALYGGWRATRRRTAQSVQTGGFAVLSPSASPIAVEAAIEGAAADTSEDGNDISQDD